MRKKHDLWVSKTGRYKLLRKLGFTQSKKKIQYFYKQNSFGCKKLQVPTGQCNKIYKFLKAMVLNQILTFIEIQN